MITTLNTKSLQLFVLAAAALTLIASGCQKYLHSGKTVAPPAESPSPQSPAESPQGGVAEITRTKYFQGSIGSSLDLQMKLLVTGEKLTGNYYYQRIGTKIALSGTLDKDGGISLDEFDPSGKQTGVFRGIWQADPDGLVTIAGNWSKPPGEKGEEKKTAFSIHEIPISLSGDAEIVSKSIKESNKKLVYEIEALYPQITGGSNSNFEKFNQAVRGLIFKKVAAFKKDVTPEPDEEPRPENSMGSDLGIGYDIGLAQDELISITFSVSSYYQGAAHPNSYTDVINYDLKNGKPLGLADLFKPNAKYLQALSTFCIADLKKQSKEKDSMLDDDSIKSGAGPALKNYHSWSITKKGLGINFDAYQVGPYVAGPQFVMVPYSTVKDLINPDGPIGQFAK